MKKKQKIDARTERLVRKCFCSVAYSCYPCDAEYNCSYVRRFAVAARRFVRLEQVEKAKIMDAKWRKSI